MWIYWWEAVIHLNESFPMSMLAMRAETWSALLKHSTTVTQLSQLAGAKQRVFTTEGETTDTWEVDQSVTTTAILTAGLCSPPKNASVWSKLALKPETIRTGEHQDKRTCWHGQGWGQCRASLGTYYFPGMSGCTWWHAGIPREVIEQLLPTDSPLYRS